MKNPVPLRHIAVAAVTLLMAPFAAAQSSAPLATINGIAIPQLHADLYARSGVPRGTPDTPELRQQIKEVLINREVAAQEAQKRGLDRNAEVAAQIEMSRRDILFNALIQDYARTSAISDDALKSEYERYRARLGDREYKARHILVKTEDEAKQLIAQIRKGASFEKLAADKSEDAGSKGRGGELDWTPPGNYLPAIREALLKLKKGEMSDAPVRSRLGWHVLRVDDERAYKAPGFEEVKPRLQQELRNQALNKLIADLRAKAKIE